MANIAENNVMLFFKENTSLEKKKEVINYMEEHLFYDGPYNYIEEPDLEYDSIELSYGTKWSEQPEILQEICNKFDVRILGACYEFGCLYVNSFELYKKTEEYE